MNKDLLKNFSYLLPSVGIKSIFKKNILTLPVGAKILEIGVGNGFISNALKEKGYDTYAADISDHCLESLHPGVKKLKIDIGKEELPFEKEYFDAVIIFEVLEHLQYPEDALKKLKKTLKKGGLIFASTPNINWFPFRLYFLLGRCPEDFHTTDHLQFWNLKRFRKIFEKSGFKVIKQFTSVAVPNFFYFLTKNFKRENFEIIGRYMYIDTRRKSRFFGYEQFLIAERDN